MTTQHRTSPTRFIAHILLLPAILLMTLAGCGQTPDTPEPTVTPTVDVIGSGTGERLRILHPQAPQTLNPHLTSSVRDWEACRLTYEPLATFDKDGDLIPFLAAEIPSLDNGGVAEDGRSVTWTLKQGLTWSDGEPFTAKDVVFTYEYIVNPDVGAKSGAVYRGVSSVEALDDHTVRVNFEEVTPAWYVPFVGFQGMILPEHLFGPYNGANAANAPANTLPVGTGPYRVMEPGIKPQEVLLLGTKLVETNKIVYERNPNFRAADGVYFSRVEFLGGGTVDEAARRVLQTGDVDYAYELGRLTPDELTGLEAGGQGELVSNYGSKVDRIMLNHTDPNRETASGERSSLEFEHPFFSDKLVRQAFAHAIDREAIAALYGPGGQPTTNVLVAPPQFRSPNTFYSFDLNAANALLDEAGWETNASGVREKDGQRLRVVYQLPTTHPVEIQQIVKDDLESIGVAVEIKIVDPGSMFGPCSADPDSAWCFNADLQEFAIRSTSPDPSSYMQIWTQGSIPQQDNNWSGLNFERWVSDEYDALHAQSTTELNPEVRAQLFIEMNDLLVEDVVMIPVVYLADVQGVNQNIEGVDLTPWDTNTWNIKDWRRTQ